MPRNFTRTLNDLNTKLIRQQAAVAATLEMIEAVKALQDREDKPNAPKLTK